MSRKQLTSKQHSFLQYLADHVRKQKVWPTYREIVDHFGYRSPNSVTQNLQALAKKGYLMRDQHGYRLVGQRAGLQAGGFPVQGTVEDGTFEVSLSINELTLKDLFPDLDKTFAVHLSGQGARGVDAGDGDYVLLADGSVEDGDMAAVLHDGDVAVCRLFHNEGGVRLQHTDGSEDFVNDDDLRILGRYAGHINRRGLFRLPGNGALNHRLDPATVSST